MKKLILVLLLCGVCFGRSWWGGQFNYDRPTGGSATYTVAASNATPESKIRADYICDGSDDQVQIQAAIDALPVSGGKIYLTEGTYSIDANIMPTNSDWTLTGSGNGTVLKLANDTNDIILILETDNTPEICMRYTVSYILFDGNKGNQTIANPLIKVDNHTHNGTDVYGFFDHIYVKDSKGSGLLVKQPHRVDMDDSWIINCDSHGIEHTNAAHFDLNHVRIVDNGGNGYHATDYMEDAKFVHCWFMQNTGHGAYRFRQASIVECLFFGNGGDGLNLCTGGCAISGCQFAWNTGHGIYDLRGSALTGSIMHYNRKSGLGYIETNAISGCKIAHNSHGDSNAYSEISLIINKNVISNCCIGTPTSPSCKYAIEPLSAAYSEGNLITNNIVYAGLTGTIKTTNWETDVEDLPNRIYANIGGDEIVTSGTVTLQHWGYSELDSNAGSITGTLPDGFYIGQIKTIIMTDANNLSTVSATHHETSVPEVATFDAVDEVWILTWVGMEWVTMKATCTF